MGTRKLYWILVALVGYALSRGEHNLYKGTNIHQLDAMLGVYNEFYQSIKGVSDESHKARLWTRLIQLVRCFFVFTVSLFNKKLKCYTSVD